MGENISSFQQMEFTGDGSPEGVVRAALGAIYRNLTGGAVYRKTTSSNVNTGWVLDSPTAGFSTVGVALATAPNPGVDAIMKVGSGNDVQFITEGATGALDTVATPTLNLLNGLVTGASA